jgi:crotonobetainyl-CoA:carnitine CoA-transferase CaiB-like acyl-CoA transferase
MTEPLEGYTVLELAVAVQGPAAGLYLRDMGAEVLKVEPPFGDSSRHGRARNNEMPEGTFGPQFVAVNRGKRSLCIDLTTELGIKALHGLLELSDVVLTNYRAPALKKLGLDYETLHERYPDLIYASVNGFGPVGPDSDKAMLDGAAIARGGLLSLTGTREGMPVLPGAVVGDTGGAMQLALGVLTALLARERFGGGQQVCVSALGTQLWFQQWELTHQSMTGRFLQRDGQHHSNIRGPYGVYETLDGGAIFLAHAMDLESWDVFCSFAGLPELAIHPGLQTPAQRLGDGMSDEDSDTIRANLKSAFLKKPKMTWDAFLRTQPEIIWERVRNHEEVLEDKQSLLNEYFTHVNIPGVGARQTVANLVKMSETPGTEKGDPPSLGEANSEFLSQTGMSQLDIQEIERAVVAVREEAIAALASAKAAR